MRVLRVAAAGAVLVGVMVGCTPAPISIVGLAVRDGSPVGVIVTCGGTFSQLSVYENEPGHRLVLWGVHGTPTTEVVEVVLFGEPPEGWQVSDTEPVTNSSGEVMVWIEPLTELRPSTHYSLGGTSARQALPVRFTTEDLPRIGPDQVLTTEDGRTSRIVSRDDFIKTARDACP